jgi:hypothetical protein
MKIPMIQDLTAKGCPSEPAVLAAVADGSLAEPGASAELRRHAASCASCRDLALVAAAIRAEGRRARRAAAVPSAGLVWWRAELRNRQEAARKAAAPLTAVHALAIVGTIALAAGLVTTVVSASGTTAWWIDGLVQVLPSWDAIKGQALEPTPFLRYGVPLGLLAWLVLAPVALYLAVRRQ